MTAPVTTHALTDALLRHAINEFGRWDRDGASYAYCFAAMRAVLAPALAPPRAPDFKALARDIDFAMDVTEPRDVLLARFEKILRKEWARCL